MISNSITFQTDTKFVLHPYKPHYSIVVLNRSLWICDSLGLLKFYSCLSSVIKRMASPLENSFSLIKLRVDNDGNALEISMIFSTVKSTSNSLISNWVIVECLESKSHKSLNSICSKLFKMIEYDRFMWIFHTPLKLIELKIYNVQNTKFI